MKTLSPPPAGRAFPYFLEIFAGSGRLSKAVSQHGSLKVLFPQDLPYRGIDLLRDDLFNSYLAFLTALAAKGHMLFFHVATS